MGKNFGFSLWTLFCLGLTLTLGVSAQSDKNVPADYEVPVPAELSEFARLPLTDYRTRVKGPNMVVDYHLPRELTGAGIRVKFLGPIPKTDVYSLTGKFGKMDCDSTACLVKYQGLSIDTQKVEEFIDQMSQSPAEAAARKEVAKIFGTEPIGIIRFK